MHLTIPEIIRKKRDGNQLSSEEIQLFVESVITKSIDDSQIGAMLMAIYLNKLTTIETVNLTESMINTGKSLTFEKFGKDILVDKHSTGGVGDKISVILAPALAACGLKVPMISGRSLGYTGGTLDKLESIPGYKVCLNIDQMNECLEKCGCFISGATDCLAPADSILYKIRDITGTADEPSLIASSILSKKAAEGIGTLVVDVKFGRGSMLKGENEAKKLAELLKKVAKSLDLNIRIIISDMNVPLGKFIGNSLEIIESVMCLKNEISNSVTELVKLLGGVVLESKGITKTIEEGEKMIQDAFENFTALNCFQQMLVLQGISEKQAQDLCSGAYWNVLPKSPYTTLLQSPRKGIITAVDALSIAKACWHLGAGRTKAEDKIDHSVGVILLKTVGEYVDENEPWIEIHHSTEKVQSEVETLVRKSLLVKNDGWNVNKKLKTCLI